MAKLKGLATGIGSLPHKDAEAALDLVFKYTPQIPFWPQLPKRDVREGMVAQFSENLPCFRFRKEGIFFDAQNEEQELEKFYDRIIAGDVDYFQISEDFALGLHKFRQRLTRENLKNVEFIKGHVVGPFTFAASINDANGIALLHNSVFMQAILKGLVMKALWQIAFFKQFGKRIILFFDEPYLGCFGSAYTPISREDAVRGLSELTQAVKVPDVLVGIHCCGNTDWSIFTDVTSIDIISFDAFSFLERLVLYGENLKKFFKRGGILCWGIVPTQEFTGKETPDALAKRIKAGVDILAKKGLDKELVVENLLLSPSCGIGTLDSSRAEKILKLLSETAINLFDNLA